LPIGHAFIELASVDSTNNYAMALASASSASHGTLIFAREQWAGKGQRGRTWSSAPGENILLSVVLQPVPLTPSRSFILSASVALACHDFFSRYAAAEFTSIKWPNDIYWRDRKAGGILIENNFQGDRWAFAIAGIGININQVNFPSSAVNPVSLRQITGRDFSAVGLARELGGFLEARYRQLEAGDASGLVLEYNARLYKRGEKVRLKKDNASFETIIRGVSEDGELLTSDTLDRSFRWGEVEWMVAP
jgi:BirA family biotin operon repressor/biotin-[acetyl-CoA-carboxylase] ligase